MKDGKKKSLLKSILYSAVGVLFCVIVVVCALFVTAVNTNMFNSKKSEIYYRVAEQSSDMNAWMIKHTTIVENLALTAKVNDLRGDELKTYLHDSVLNVSPSIMDCYVSWVDESPFMACAVFVPADDYVPESRGWYKSAVEADGTIITDPYIDAFTGKIVITVATMIKDDNGKNIGCCGLDIDITELVDLTSEMHADETGYAILVDASDNVVVDTRYEEYSHHLDGETEVVTALAEVAPVYEKVLQAKSGSIVAGKDIDGNKCFFPVVELGDTGWKLLYAADYGEAKTAVTVYTILVIIIGLLGIVGGSVFLYSKFTRRLKPLGNIEVIVNEMEAGNLDHAYPDTVNDEVGVICRVLRRTNLALKSYVGDISRNLSRMAEGDFHIQFEAEYVGEFTSIKSSLEQISSAMVALLQGVGAASGQVNDSAGSVSGTSALLASGAQEQSRTVEQLSQIVESLVVQIEENSASANKADLNTKKTVQTIQESSGQMEDLVHSMDEITELSEKVGEIVNTINDIASQTNILALNASIEAARAGEAGRGFAVVADEVQNMAQKSTEAAKGTGQLIQSTIEAIEVSARLAHDTAEFLSSVVEDAENVSILVEGINLTSQKQNQEVTRIHDSLSDLGDIAARNTETAEKSAVASEVLNRQAQNLDTLLQKYQK